MLEYFIGRDKGSLSNIYYNLEIIIMATLAEIRAKLLAQEKKFESNTQQSQGPNALFRHWDIPIDSTAVLRFLPDGDTTNDYFWRERQMIKLEFPGIEGGDTNRPVTIQVPCVEMWGEACPVHAEIRPWYKDPSMEKLASKYWKKRSYIFQGFVVTDPGAETEKPENPIRRFLFSPQIFKNLKSALMDPDMENMPTDYDGGTDFRIVKVQNGQYADYSTSSYARKERSLSEEERAAIEEHGLFDLNDFMPKRPSEEELAVIMEMFEASVDGQLYDPIRWGNFYRPYGLDMENFKDAVPNNSSGTTAKESAPTPKVSKKAEPVKEEKVEEVEDDTPPFEADETPKASTSDSEKKQDAADILAMIRSRKTS